MRCRNVQSGSAENLPAAMEMVTSASEGLIEAYSAAAELDPTLHARMLGFRQSIVADIASLQPHVGDPVSLERIGHHMGNVTQLFGGAGHCGGARDELARDGELR